MGQCHSCSACVLGAESFRLQRESGQPPAQGCSCTSLSRGCSCTSPLQRCSCTSPSWGWSHASPLWGCSCIPSAGWPHPSGQQPQLTPVGAEEMLMGPQLVPWGLQQLLSLAKCQDPPAALPVSMDRAVQLCLAGSLRPGTANATPSWWRLFPAPRPPKIQFAFLRNQPGIFTAGEKAAAEEGGSKAEQSSAEPQGCCINMQSGMPARRWPDGVWLIQTNCCGERWQIQPQK